MPEHLHVVLRTERGATEPVEIRCGSDDFWSVAQQRAMERLYPRAQATHAPFVDLRRRAARIIPRFVPPYSRALVGTLPGFATAELTLEVVERLNQACFYALRARRIAAAYACVFLEDFEHGNPALIGRFYWAGLAAFASKQVACTLDHPALAQAAPDTAVALGKGNLWLYNDAWPWHFAWALCPGSVHMCMDKRSAENFDPVVLANLRDQEWADEVLPRLPCPIDERTGKVGQPIGQLGIAPLMREAINAWETYGLATSLQERQQYAMEHLMAMARHEQGEVLQGLVYDSCSVQTELELGGFVRDKVPKAQSFLMFKLQLSFSAEEYVEDTKWRSDAPEGIRISDYRERMKWIGDAAKQYHRLMTGEHRQAMLAQLRILADHDG